MLKKNEFDWTEYQEVDSPLSNNQEFILHLHGIVTKPDSIILSQSDYKKLSGELGYKHVLKSLWTGYHFLFIGCSRDGVMDDDFTTIFSFLNEWFPSRTHGQFILLREKDIKSGVHISLIEKCNIEAIGFGPSHEDLPGFIKTLNPNADKLKGRIQKVQQEIDGTVERLKTLFGYLVTDHASMINVLKETLRRA